MTRNFLADPVSPDLVRSLVDLARRSPSAGNTQARHFLVLEGADVANYWNATLSPERRDRFPWPGLLQAPALIVAWVDPGAYVERYAEADKASTGLGSDQAAWSTPYWWVDGGMAAMAILLGAESAGLGALFFGVFEHETKVRATFAVPEHMRAIGAIAIGWPAGEQRPSASADRARDRLEAVLHSGAW